MDGSGSIGRNGLKWFIRSSNISHSEIAYFLRVNVIMKWMLRNAFALKSKYMWRKNTSNVFDVGRKKKERKWRNGGRNLSSYFTDNEEISTYQYRGEMRMVFSKIMMKIQNYVKAKINNNVFSISSFKERKFAKIRNTQINNNNWLTIIIIKSPIIIFVWIIWINKRYCRLYYLCTMKYEGKRLKSWRAVITEMFHVDQCLLIMLKTFLVN